MTTIIFKPSEEVIYKFLKRNDECLMKTELIKEEIRKEKKSMRRSWKLMARNNYHKK